MFNFLKTYVHPFEKKVDSFLLNLNTKSSPETVQKKLLILMQENTAILNVWLEKKAKNYAHLKNHFRLEKYRNLEEIEKKIDIFWQKKEFTPLDSLFIKQSSLQDREKLNYLWAIAQFCQRFFNYQASASFDKLLVDLNYFKMEGDCNQIVTFYIHLYSRQFPISDLKIKLYPEHVSLMFGELEIEATSGVFIPLNQQKKGKILNVSEIISTNLLDIPDFRVKSKNITPHTFLKTARLAFLLSSLSEIVQNNLNVALTKLVKDLIQAKKFNLALDFVKQMQGDTQKKLFEHIIQNAVIFFVNQNQFKQARYFAQKNLFSELKKYILQNELKYYLNQDNFKKAQKVALDLKDQESLRYVAKSEYIFLASQLKQIKTITDAKKNRIKFEKLLFLAKQSHDLKLTKWPYSVLQQLKNQ